MREKWGKERRNIDREKWQEELIILPASVDAGASVDMRMEWADEESAETGFKFSGG